ncbi:uncharacterized protein LOC115663365 [Syzygium oleosum]|uniref:uncharacterized protein LOC115663365 n=1 Tax=Syzygium oleosum TaxID=219896 RepID=UPI0011D24AF9|nr:uncharacterized protein LOC115663365 [Syzygium oleosum]
MIQVYGNLTSMYHLTFGHFEIIVDVNFKRFDYVANICHHCANCRIIANWAKFKNDGFPKYPELCIVFGDTYVTGEHAARNAEDLMESEENDNGGGDANGDPEDISEHHIDKGVFTSDNIATSVHDKHELNRTPKTKKRRKSNSFDVAGTCKAIQEMIKSKASQSLSGSATSQVTSPPVDPFFVSAVIDVLVSMPKLEQDIYNKAVERAYVSATLREDFIKSPTERRNGLLQCLK